MATSALKALARTHRSRGDEAVQLLALMLQGRVETNVAHFSAGFLGAAGQIFGCDAGVESIEGCLKFGFQ